VAAYLTKEESIHKPGSERRQAYGILRGDRFAPRNMLIYEKEYGEAAIEKQ